ncbi:MAG: sulfurtransferase TusA family protein [Bacillota bacterium]
MKIIDCLGEICPVPVLRIKDALRTMKSNDSIKVVTDHSCVQQSIIDHFSKSTLHVVCEEVMNGIWEIVITKI